MQRTRIHLKYREVLFILFSFLLLAGCSVQAASNTLEGNGVPLNYEIIKPPFNNSQIEQAVAAQQNKGGAQSIHLNHDTFVIISLGQRPSGGYAVHIEKVAKQGNQIVVKYSEKKPEGMAISVITYPTIVLKLSNQNTPVKIQQVK